MLYSSCNGCFFYYDSVLYGWRIAEPTMLFLLGYEAVTTYDKSASDCLLIPKYAYHTYDDELVPLEYVNEIYDEIYHFLSKTGTVEDLETSAKFNCYGLKLLMNDMTGMHNDRTVPIIFKNDTNKSLIDVNDTPSYITDLEKVSMSYYDLQALKIKEIFTYAGYIYDSTREFNPADYSEDLKEGIIKYNASLKSDGDERKQYSDIFKLLDYKAMYSYALGVLYGCRCLGFDDNAIWRLEPTYWYNGNYKNLVDTAWRVFRFSKYNYIPAIDGNEDKAQFDKYKSIINNKLWNFEEDCNSKLSIPLRDYEVPLYLFSIDENGSIKAQPIIHSRYEDNSRQGEFLMLDQNDADYNQWLDFTDYTAQSLPTLVGALSVNDDKIVRYIANDEVKFIKAYKWNKEGSNDQPNNFLSPNETNQYFTAAGNSGWMIFDPTYIDNEHNNTLHLYPESISDRDSSIFGYALDTQDSSIVTYYKCYLDASAPIDNPTAVTPSYTFNETTLCGIYDKYISQDEDLPEHFDEIISYRDIGNGDMYRYKIVSEFAGYTQKTYYNIAEPINVLVNSDETKIWGGTTDPSADIPIDQFGYTPSPAIAVDAYNENNVKLNIRKYNNKFWSDDNNACSSEWTARTWHDSLPDGIYLSNTYLVKDETTIHLYRNIVRLTGTEIPLYGLTPETSASYIFNDCGLDVCEANTYIKYKNDPISYEAYDDLYTTMGITGHLCTIVLQDDEGNYLTDDETATGNPLVWYDPDPNVERHYWNGVFGVNRWQETKPNLFGSIMYDSLDNEEKQVRDNSTAQKISVDGIIYTYEEFYSDMHHGIIREKLKVFNPDVDGEGIILCYHDNADGYDRYIIPNKESLPEWVSRESISAIGYWFVDGTATLYDGNVAESVVVDDHHED